MDKGRAVALRKSFERGGKSLSRLGYIVDSIANKSWPTAEELERWIQDVDTLKEGIDKLKDIISTDCIKHILKED